MTFHYTSTSQENGVPRRNRNARRSRPRPVVVAEEREPTTDELARRLVSRGLASPRIRGTIPLRRSSRDDTAA